MRARGILVALGVVLALPHRAAAVRSLRTGAAEAATVGLPVAAPAPSHESRVPAAQEDTQPHVFFPERQKHYELAPIGEAVVLYGVTCCVVLAASALAVCCLYDAAAHWCHRSHFHSCQTKVQRVHETFFKKKGEPAICPYCVEYISGSSRTSQPVVFLCGHRFHMECANRWFQDNPDMSGKCPLCEARSPGGKDDVAEVLPEPQVPLALASRVEKCSCQDHGSPAESSNNEVLSFILGSLHREYPDIITEECMRRWSSCHAEIWLSELSCPKYHSLLHSQLQ